MSNDAFTVADIENMYATLVSEHSDNLESLGVKLPPLHSKGGFNRRALQLILLRLRYQELVSKIELTDFVKKFEPNSAGDQQARHLAYDGWDVRCSGKSGDKFKGKKIQNGYHVLASVEHPATKFMSQRMKRLGRLAATDWQSLQEAYDHRCATCGKQCKEKLEQGHKNPKLSHELSNIIPMCGPCNNWAGDRFIFNDDGRVVALASPAIVLDSPDDVQYQVFLELRRRFKN
ncbi:hypothetical protein [Serratia nevei]|uniref:hypothetical protein n=1 Tax=Serratia nevei TaxID=2703794 RepID=UPI002551B0E5|nr:hypothetical protein [Serratia nevei]MDK5165489.1 hypothetical protein [Serratia nevei]